MLKLTVIPKWWYRSSYHDIFVWTQTRDIPYFNERQRVEIGNICSECSNKMTWHRRIEPISRTYVYFYQIKQSYILFQIVIQLKEHLSAIARLYGWLCSSTVSFAYLGLVDKKDISCYKWEGVIKSSAVFLLSDCTLCF